MRKGSVAIAGALAQKPGYGGHTWVFLNWLLGFQRLGWDVLFVDWLGPEMVEGSIESSANLAYLRAVMQSYGLDDRWALIATGGGESAGGKTRADVIRELRGADLLLNFGGYLQDEELLGAARRRVFLDIDPGFGQMWRARGLHDPYGGHDCFVTVGTNIGRPDCRIPTCGLDWVTTLPPVVIDMWPARGGGDAFTSVGAWRGPFAPVEYDGRTFGLRVHEFRKFAALPRLTGQAFEMALDIHEAEVADLELLRENGWRLVPPATVTGTPDAYRGYVADSKAEIMVAKNIYVDTCGGWFSDRTACYLATGKPALAQDTGLRSRFPSGIGLVLFSSVEEAAAGVEAIERDYQRHSRAAREIAESELDSNRVITSLLDRISA